MNSPSAFDFIQLPNRSQKPRESGLTMMLDKGLTLSEVKELSEMAAGYIDLAKLGWGTSRILSRNFVKAKIEMYQSYGISVSPGGTFLEIAAERNLMSRISNSGHWLSRQNNECDPISLASGQRSRLQDVRPLSHGCQTGT